jgi:hypothetical protein
MIKSQTAAGSTIELPGYGYELPTKTQICGFEQVNLKRTRGTLFYHQPLNGQL